MFPSEVKDTYFMKDVQNKNTKGKLYAKYYNAMRTLKSCGLVPSKGLQVKRTIDTETHRQYNKEFVPEYDIDYIVDQIKYDLNCSFPDLENNWKSTTNYRLNEIKNFVSISEIIKNWNSYTLPLGYRLVDIDFHTLYPNCSSLLNTFENKFENIVKLMDEKLKDSTNRRLFETLRDDASIINQNGKNTVLLYLLHAILVPTAKKITKDHNGKKCQIKYLIKDSQNSFMTFKNSVAEIEEHIVMRQNEKNPIQPFIIIVGTPTNPKEIIVFFDCIKYKLFTILSAVDVCFKLFHLFNLEYPCESCVVWLFIQKYFYSLTTNFDKSFHTLGQILSDFKQ
ncbi:uncharacterized protein LOC111031246 [Myzus persicae]|uniref:uncharacterized protein LOC111031246 n=1 Tax=Myzus persicae TaxID=13164 RepID=UPI000B933012|nr:uncharacterized protein LOC111031246 [Myzus persicae]